MKPELEKIIENNIVNNLFLDKESLQKCVEESYNLGVNDVISWLSNMDYLSANIKYIIEEWNNQNKL
jgi:hypothetical protein